MGLGNPGAAYAASRHNAGFMAVDRLAERWRIPLAAQPTMRIGDGVVAGQRALLLEPQTYMNRSGDVLAELERRSDDPLVVIHDDLDLPPGQLRVRPRGGSGGHRGVASIAARIGEEFIRIRIGIGRPPPAVDAAEYVLGTFSDGEGAALRRTVERACDAVECVLARGAAMAMNQFNGGEAPSESTQTTKE